MNLKDEEIYWCLECGKKAATIKGVRIHMKRVGHNKTIFDLKRDA